MYFRKAYREEIYIKHVQLNKCPLKLGILWKGACKSSTSGFPKVWGMSSLGRGRQSPGKVWKTWGTILSHHINPSHPVRKARYLWTLLVKEFWLVGFKNRDIASAIWNILPQRWSEKSVKTWFYQLAWGSKRNMQSWGCLVPRRQSRCL